MRDKGGDNRRLTSPLSDERTVSDDAGLAQIVKYRRLARACWYRP